ncbi:MAG TPA: carboxypeptidase-like regulatory domain-containing protein [Pyrinomonadaceae bacterium]|nr:carboxypeptidase-like regulatory domain-containing protein [Pyrinomonadaceae bacterium]
MRHIFFRIVLAAAAIVLQTSIAFACTCAPKRPVLDEYEWSSVVMIARIASVEKAAKADKTEHDYGVRSSRLVVEKVYKGDVRVGEELVFAQGSGANCLMRFSEETIDDRMLIYEGRPPAGTPWSVSFCGRSAGVERATEDLLYLDKLDQVRGQTRVSGKYAGGFYGRQLKVSGRKIRIVSEADAYETTTDDKGIFEIYGLPPGNYRLEPELDPGITLDPAWIGLSSVSRDGLRDTYVAFTLKPKRHVSIELGFKSKDQKWGGEARPK